MPSLLLVDPEPSVIVTLKMILERDGYQVSTATSYAAAAALLQSESWDILITELDLEAEALGLRLAGEAKSLHPQPAIFVYASYPNVERLRAALACVWTIAGSSRWKWMRYARSSGCCLRAMAPIEHTSCEFHGKDSSLDQNFWTAEAYNYSKAQKRIQLPCRNLPFSSSMTKRM